MADIDWARVARRGQLKHALHLLACRLAWIRHGDLRAHCELANACHDTDPDIREIAAGMLAGSRGERADGR